MAGSLEMPESGVSAVGERLSARLRSQPLLAGIGEAAMESLAAAVEWRSLAAGQILFREGDPGDAMYIVDSGCLAVMRNGGNGDAVIGVIRAGQTVGEMALLSGDPRSATVAARRDSRLIRIGVETYQDLLGRHPGLALHLAAELARRLNRLTHYQPAQGLPKTLALVPLMPDLHEAVLARRIGAEFVGAGHSMRIIGKEAAGQPVEWFNAVETANDIVLFIGEPVLSAWTRFCLRQADRILLLTQSGRWMEASPAIPAEITGSGRRFDLAVLHPAGSPGGQGSGSLPGMELCCHLRPHCAGDLARLARLASGEATGLVLAGGGARSFAHIGAIRALRAAGVPLDLVGGTSMGAIIAAGVACDWDDDELRKRLRHALVDSNPVNDYTVPWLSLTRGSKVERRLRHHFGDIAIEELWRPFFCLSSSLTRGCAVVHRSGPLWRALRASIGIPGLLPPVAEAGELLVDGGVVNNFPVDVMRAMHRGPVIGINVVTDHVSILPDLPHRRRSGSGWTPPIISILVRAGTMSSEAQVQLGRDQADLLIEPPLADIGLLDWQAFDRAIEIGYRSTMESLERHGRNTVPSRIGIQGLL